MLLGDILMSSFNIREILNSKIIELVSRYSILDFNSGFFEKLVNDSISNLDSADISKLESNFTINFKKSQMF